LYGTGQNIEYNIKGSDVINGKVYVMEEGIDTDGSLFRVIWLRKDSVGDVVLGAYQANKPIIPNIDSATIVSPPFAWFPNQFLTSGYKRDYSAIGMPNNKDSVVSITETVQVPAGTFTNCLKICITNLDNLGNATRREYDYYAKGIGMVKATVEIHNPGTIELIAYKNVTSVQDKTPVFTIHEFALEQNYPNPFNPSTVISYQVASFGKVSLKLFDLLGSEVATLVNEVKSAGTYTVTFNAANMPSGVYFYRLKAGSFSKTKKLVLLR
jgi:hypothetical protein